ncbi:plasmid mobilization relaxosome protein MobC [Streptomyces sp. NBC_01477]|uniref:plasmid mobilization relaxosome protein MobC n=1 Tax=Streptomyces sp. NBC_01477 TaxID=2976015 RepID=UPI002E378A27|nr:plasmid mobilization relaxosome protein MobC [Streptomyces sp. NBC_01477]
MAEGARREGAPGGEAGAASGPDTDQLTTVQRAVLATAHADERPHTMPTSTPGPAAKAARLDSDSDGEVRETVAAFVHDKVPALDVPPLPTHPQAQVMPKGKIRRFNGKRRTLRVGPVGFTESEHADLLAAAERHGYEGTLSGYLADIALAFIRGAFTVDLPLHTDRQAVQEFRAQIRYEINRIGVNINQMVYVLHRDDRIEPDIRERLEHLDLLLTRIARALLLPAEAASRTDGEDA